MTKIYSLSDNQAREGFKEEHGFSVLIESGEKTILFDAGASDLFHKNAQVHSKDISGIDLIALSHGHWDHATGLKFLRGKTIIACPGIFKPRFRKRDKSPVGIVHLKEELSSKNNFEWNRGPFELAKEVWFLGEIPRKLSFESKETFFVFENDEDDFIPDDTGLVIKTPKGSVLISGCAHSGICNMMEYAKEVTGEMHFHAVIGGFHLKLLDDKLKQTREYLLKQSIDKIYPSHCTSFRIIRYLAEKLPVHEWKVGDVFEV